MSLELTSVVAVTIIIATIKYRVDAVSQILVTSYSIL
jgi:hypothetical protein